MHCAKPSISVDMAAFHDHEIFLATDGFSSSRIIGRGSHGCVYKGILPERNSIVAVKTSSFSASNSSTLSSAAVSLEKATKLENEMRILSSLPKNPYVIGFLGMTKNLLVMEFMPNGSLHHLLHSALAPPPSWPQRLQIALRIARGVRFLHDEFSIIHRDIKSENVLFDSDWNAKLADFGLAVPLVDNSEVQPAGTLGYLDPDYSSPSRLSTRVDVFSFGVVLLEILTGGKAFDTRRVPASIVDWAIPLVRQRKLSEVLDCRVMPPSQMKGAVLRVLHLASRCVSSYVERRPSFSEIVAEIEFGIGGGESVVPTWITVLLARRWRKWARWYWRKSMGLPDHVDGYINSSKKVAPIGRSDTDDDG